MFKTKQRRREQVEQRRLLQQAGLEKEYRRVQRLVKRGYPKAELHLYKDITPTSLGEFVYILEIYQEDDYIAQIVGADIEDVIKTTEDWINE